VSKTIITFVPAIKRVMNSKLLDGKWLNGFDDGCGSDPS
jgi:hypothetical protein